MQALSKTQEVQPQETSLFDIDKEIRTMSKKSEWDKVDKAASVLPSMDSVEHKRPRKPTKKDLDRKFTMSVDKKGKPKITEVKD